ncbi:NYN domain-containing protein [Gottfriedia solisilvae]|uniref:NYN domain-containing protein n=1 Tax=Gottfriedia solisilvae TaxID=1516104 RepID=UPI003D2ECA02
MYICVFIDWENIEKTAKQDFGSVIDYKEFVNVIKELATRNGNKLVGIYAYGDFDKGEAGLMSKLVNLGVEPKHVITKTAHEYLKGSVDIELSLEALDTMYNYPHITHYMFISGDGDLRYILRRLTMNGKSIELMGFSKYTNGKIKEMVEVFHPLDNHPNVLHKITQTEIEKRIDKAYSNKLIQVIIEQLNRIESNKNKKFIGLNYFSKKLQDTYRENSTSISDALTEAIDLQIIETYLVDNPNDKLHPTRACKLNRELDIVKKYI